MIGVAAYLFPQIASGASGSEPPPNQLYPTWKIIAALKATAGRVYLAADRLGCDPDTIYERAKKEPVIDLAMRVARGKIVDKAEVVIESALSKGNVEAAKFVLRTMGKDRGWVELTKHEHGGPDGGAIPLQVKVMEVVAPNADDGTNR